MNATIREYPPQDEERVIELSLKAWAPVFTSLEQVLGRETPVVIDQRRVLGLARLQAGVRRCPNWSLGHVIADVTAVFALWSLSSQDDRSAGSGRVRDAKRKGAEAAERIGEVSGDHV